MLSKQLQEQIEQEGKGRAVGFENRLSANIAKTEYELGAEKYAALYETAVARAERAERALRDFAEKLNEVCGQNGIITAGIHFIIDEMLMYEYVNHKNGSDENT